jgi:hypothetical protein
VSEPVSGQPAVSRLVDAGAVFAGWVGIGVSFVIVVAFALIIPFQLLVFVLAPFIGLLMGWYANARSERRRPRLRVLLNAAWAGVPTALALAGLYLAIRLLFIYADTGALPDGTNLDCRAGPDCTYTRHVVEGRGPELAQQGITDAATFEAVALREHAFGAAGLLLLTLAGAVVAGAGQALGRSAEAGAAA